MHFIHEPESEIDTKFQYVARIRGNAFEDFSLSFFFLFRFFFFSGQFDRNLPRSGEMATYERVGTRNLSRGNCASIALLKMIVVS